MQKEEYSYCFTSVLDIISARTGVFSAPGRPLITRRCVRLQRAPFVVAALLAHGRSLSLARET